MCVFTTMLQCTVQTRLCFLCLCCVVWLCCKTFCFVSASLRNALVIDSIDRQREWTLWRFWVAKQALQQYMWSACVYVPVVWQCRCKPSLSPSHGCSTWVLPLAVRQFVRHHLRPSIATHCRNMTRSGKEQNKMWERKQQQHCICMYCILYTVLLRVQYV